MGGAGWEKYLDEKSTYLLGARELLTPTHPTNSPGRVEMKIWSERAESIFMTPCAVYAL